MARIVLNPAIQIISGDVGGFVYRQEPDGSVIVAKPPMIDPDRIPTEAQAQQLQRFKDACARYQRLMENAGVKAAYEEIVAERGPMARLRAMVIGDILKAPKVNTVDLSNYTGAVGDTIRILAEDNVGVSRIKLTIYDKTGDEVVEMAEKLFADNIRGGVEWVYTATTAVPGESLIEIQVTASDLAENETALVQAMI